MDKTKVQTLKGFRDFLPNEARKRQYVINKLKGVFELYGFEPLETPALEYEELLMGKYGEEGEKLMYKFKDNGGRDVALRYDQTVPLARVIAQYQDELPIPFKRYQIQPVWRAENTQLGRYREFLQCDVDIAGSVSRYADLEIVECIYTALQTLGFEDFTILVNSRKIFDKFGANKRIIGVLDKEDKIGKDKVLDLLSEVLGSDENALKFYDELKNISEDEYPESLKIILKERERLNLFFSPFLARGLDYYTDLIFEVRIPKYKGGSVGGGGRYDNLAGIFGDKQIPAVGFAFGFDRLIEAMEELKLFPEELSTTKVLTTVFSNDLEEKSLQITKQLRQAGINTDIWLDAETKLDKQLRYADQKGIPYVIIIGPDEATKDLVTLKDLKNQTQETLSLDETIQKLSS